jgi:hypothetical protein
MKIYSGQEKNLGMVKILLDENLKLKWAISSQSLRVLTDLKNSGN